MYWTMNVWKRDLSRDWIQTDRLCLAMLLHRNPGGAEECHAREYNMALDRRYDRTTGPWRERPPIGRESPSTDSLHDPSKESLLREEHYKLLLFGTRPLPSASAQL